MPDVKGCPQRSVVIEDGEGLDISQSNPLPVTTNRVPVEV